MQLAKHSIWAGLGGKLMVTAVTMATVSACSQSGPSKPSSSPTPTRTYLHPTADISRITNDCDSDGNPYIIIWITNHSSHSMAYHITVATLDASGKPVGSADGILQLVAGQFLPDQRLFSTKGSCGKSVRLASVDAYNADGLNGQPDFQ